MLNITFSLKSAYKKVLCIGVCIGVLLAAFCFSRSIESNNSGKTNEQRIAYLQSLGLEVVTAPAEVQQVIIPEIFSDVYSRYNTIQRKAGFDLSDYKGETVKLFKYKMHDEAADAFIIVFKEKIIGGHICGRAEGSEMLPLELR